MIIYIACNLYALSSINNDNYSNINLKWKSIKQMHGTTLWNISVYQKIRNQYILSTNISYSYMSAFLFDFWQWIKSKCLVSNILRFPFTILHIVLFKNKIKIAFIRTDESSSRKSSAKVDRQQMQNQGSTHRGILYACRCVYSSDLIVIHGKF